MKLAFGPRRAVSLDITHTLEASGPALAPEELAHFQEFDRIYRALCALLYNYVPMSGHPGGSISSGPIAAALVFDALDYDVSQPDREDADIVSYAAGHKALGLYALWALRNEVLRVAAPGMLPQDERKQLRLEDLLGFRRNPVTATPLFKKLHSKPLDGHPTPATPFVRLSTGASGVGLAASLGLAWGAADYFGLEAPRVHIVEGEGGMTPGRVAEALAAAGTASLGNAFLHVDWNQSSIDSDRVCREGDVPGQYVQWDPRELAYLHDWNVVYVPDGKDIQQIVAAQRLALGLDNGQPTALVYRTVKGWQYGIEGRASHGAGHKLCSDGFYQALAPLLGNAKAVLPTCEANADRCRAGAASEVVEECYWEALQVVRKALVERPALVRYLAGRLEQARRRLELRRRGPRKGAPDLSRVYSLARSAALEIPEELKLRPGSSTTLRAELGRALGWFNRASGGAVLLSAADLLGSTSISTGAEGFPAGFWHRKDNPGSRLLSIGGICEDAMIGVLSGITAFGRHTGAGSSYGAFMAPLGHIAARLHAIGAQAAREAGGGAYRPFFLVCAHAGLKTGEDGPTHADPQALQLLQENFPKGTSITLTPWEPQEIWTLVATALACRPAVIAPFVTRPAENVLDREALGLAPATAAATGVYRLRSARGEGAGTVVLQGSGVTYAFVEEALPLIDKDGVDLNVYYVASAELFDLLAPEEQERIFPEEHARTAMGITDFTLPTLYRWVTSEKGRRLSLHPFGKGHFLGSGVASMVLAEAGLDGRSQYTAIRRYLEETAATLDGVR